MKIVCQKWDILEKFFLKYRDDWSAENCLLGENAHRHSYKCQCGYFEKHKSVIIRKRNASEKGV